MAGCPRAWARVGPQGRGHQGQRPSGAGPQSPVLPLSTRSPKAAQVLRPSVFPGVRRGRPPMPCLLRRLPARWGEMRWHRPTLKNGSGPMPGRAGSGPWTQWGWGWGWGLVRHQEDPPSRQEAARQCPPPCSRPSPSLSEEPGACPFSLTSPWHSPPSLTGGNTGLGGGGEERPGGPATQAAAVRAGRTALLRRPGKGHLSPPASIKACPCLSCGTLKLLVWPHLATLQLTSRCPGPGAARDPSQPPGWATRGSWGLGPTWGTQRLPGVPRQMQCLPIFPL